jgi:hypothetical protein
MDRKVSYAAGAAPEMEYHARPCGDSFLEAISEGRESKEKSFMKMAGLEGYKSQVVSLFFKTPTAMSSGSDPTAWILYQKAIPLASHTYVFTLPDFTLADWYIIARRLLVFGAADHVADVTVKFDGVNYNGKEITETKALSATTTTKTISAFRGALQTTDRGTYPSSSPVRITRDNLKITVTTPASTDASRVISIGLSEYIGLPVPPWYAEYVGFQQYAFNREYTRLVSPYDGGELDEKQYDFYSGGTLDVEGYSWCPDVTMATKFDGATSFIVSYIGNFLEDKPSSLPKIPSR